MREKDENYDSTRRVCILYKEEERERDLGREREIGWKRVSDGWEDVVVLCERLRESLRVSVMYVGDWVNCVE